MRAIGRLVVVLGLVALATLLFTLYRRQHAALAGAADADEPVVAPSRVRAVDGGGAAVVLDSADARRLGLVLVALEPGAAVPELRLPAELIPEPERVAAVRAPLGGRLAVPEGGAWPGFGERVEAGTPVAQVADARPITAPRSGVVTRVGAWPGELVQAGQLLLEITDYSAPVVRVAWPVDGPAPPPRIALAVPNGAGGARERRIPARLLGAAPAADAVTRRPAFLYRAERTWVGARPGLAVVALVPNGGAQVRGVLVPDRAIVQWEGLTWAYRQLEPGAFVRVRVPTDRPVPGGFLATAGVAPGDTVVAQGAEQLLSEEFRTRVTVGDEVDE